MTLDYDELVAGAKRLSGSTADARLAEAQQRLDWLLAYLREHSADRRGIHFREALALAAYERRFGS